MDCTADEGENPRVTFQLSNVTRPILAADVFLEGGCSVSMDGQQRGDLSQRFCRERGERIAVVVAET